MEAYEALASKKKAKALAVAAVAVGLLGAQGAGVAYGQEETTAAPTPPAPGPGGAVITEDDDRVGAGDVLVIEGGYVAGKGASLVLKDADGTTGSLVDGKNATFEKGEGGTLLLKVTKEPAGLKGGDEALSTDGLAVESSQKIREEPTSPGGTTGPAGTTAPEGTTAPGGTTGPGETTPEEPPGGATDAGQPGVLGPQETTAPEGTVPDEATAPEENPDGETPEGRPVEIGVASAVDAGDVLLVEGSYEVAEGATLALADADGTTGTLVDGDNAEFTAGEDVLEVSVAGNVLELSGGDGELTLEGLAVESSEGITALDGGGTTTGSTEPSEEPETEEPKAVEEPDEILVGDPNRTATPEAPNETTELPEEETTALTPPEETELPEETTAQTPPEETALPEETTALTPEKTALPEETTALTPEETVLPEETTAQTPPEETALPEEETPPPPLEETDGPLTVPDEGTVPDEQCAGAAEIETFSGSEGMTTAPFETAGGSFQVVYEVGVEGGSAGDEGQGTTTAEGGSATGEEFGLTVAALEHETGERVGEETADAATGDMLVEAGPGLYVLEIAPVNSDYAVTVMDCQEEDSPEEDPREPTPEEPTPDEITERYGDPGRIVEEEREETPPPASPDEGTLLPTRLPDTGGAAAVALPVASVLLGLGLLGGAVLRRRRDGR